MNKVNEASPAAPAAMLSELLCVDCLEDCSKKPRYVRKGMAFCMDCVRAHGCSSTMILTAFGYKYVDA